MNAVVTKLSAIATDNYIISELDLEQVGRTGHGMLEAKVRGFWSSDVITVRINRNISLADEGGWTFSTSHSSGGRDLKAVADDLEAELCFSQAIAAIVEHASRIREFYTDTLEHFWNKQRAEQQADRERKAAAAAAAVAADMPLGVEGAQRLFDEMLSIVNKNAAEDVLKIGQHSCTAHLFDRGSWSHNVLEARSTFGGIRWNIDGDPIAKRALLEKLANMSHRCKIISGK